MTGQANSGFGFIALNDGYKQQGIVMNGPVTVTAEFSNNILTITTPQTPQIIAGGTPVKAHYSGSSQASSGTTYNGGYGSDGTTLGSFSCYSIINQLDAIISNLSNVGGTISFDASFSTPGNTDYGVYDMACSCNYYECFIDMPVEVGPPPPPMIVTGPQGVPLGGSNTFTVNYNGLGDSITLQLNTAENGTGSAAFPDNSTTTTLNFPPGQNQSQTVTVQGVQASQSANDLTLSALWSGEQLNSQQFSVVSVTITLNTAEPLQNDPELANFLYLVGGPSPGLGAEIFYDGPEGNPQQCIVGVELIGAVTPANYSGPVTLRRTIAGSAAFQGQTPFQPDGFRSSGDDTSANSLIDSTVGAGAPGEVFDLDVPGIGPGPSPSTPGRYRTNFSEYAVLGDRTSTTQAGAAFPYFVDVSCGGTSTAPALDYSASIFDNVANLGARRLTWNLQ